MFADWSNYTPKLLKTRKNKILQIKKNKVTKCSNCEESRKEYKRKLLEFKEELLQKEHERDEELHKLKTTLGEHQIRNEMLLTEKLELEIRLLKNKLE